ncbi:unnamed protein product [Heligmosomoides polygyrus]|uniref:Histone H2A n=1 Tax=Heligmosomoides polygyrus TaxID=6339 RepID=A0A183GFK0_HELPZ|nr:unnamed protein product [Heligmosomoides polygyrus]
MLRKGNYAARDNRNTRINPRHLQLAFRNDDELIKLLSGVAIAQGGVHPNIKAPCCRRRPPVRRKDRFDFLYVSMKVVWASRIAHCMYYSCLFMERKKK